MVDKGSEFYNRSIKSWLEQNDIEMYLTHNEGKSVVVERFIRTSKNKVYKYISISKNVYIDKWDDIVNKYNNIYHNTIKMKPIDVKSSTYFDSVKKLMIKILNLKLVILLEYQNIKNISKCFRKSLFQIGRKKLLWLKTLKTLCRGHVISDLKGEEIVKTFCEKELRKKKKNQKEFRVEKVIKKKGD